MSKAVNKKQFEVVVVSNKMQKTVRVSMDKPLRHPVYHKIISRSKTFFARTDMELEVGDVVVIQESRPYSKNVRWVVISKKEEK